MWAEACAVIDAAERMHRQFFRLSVTERSRAIWEPPVDIFEDEREVVIVIALPGVEADRVEVEMEPGSIVVRAESTFPFAGSRHDVRRLEIPYGFFERRIPLPMAALEAGTREASNGCLVLHMRKVG
jgi:HSP20 family molecular chaperone IbpA